MLDSKSVADDRIYYLISQPKLGKPIKKNFRHINQTSNCSYWQKESQIEY